MMKLFVLAADGVVYPISYERVASLQRNAERYTEAIFFT